MFLLAVLLITKNKHLPETTGNKTDYQKQTFTGKNQKQNRLPKTNIYRKQNRLPKTNIYRIQPETKQITENKHFLCLYIKNICLD